MEVFLPIAQVFVNPIEILLLSAIVGVLSGLFGVGGGFLMTPFLIFLGIPPAYAVANEANNILATSVSGSTTHYFFIKFICWSSFRIVWSWRWFFNDTFFNFSWNTTSIRSTK